MKNTFFRFVEVTVPEILDENMLINADCLESTGVSNILF